MSHSAPGMDEQLPIATGRQVAAVAANYLRQQVWLVIAAVACFVIAAASSLIVPFGLGRIVDLAAGADQGQAVWGLAAAMLAGVLAAAVFGALGSLATANLVERFLAQLRETLVATGLRLPRQLVERAGAGDLVSRASDDVALASTELPNTVPAVASASFSLVLTMLGMAALHPLFALTFGFVLPVHLLALRWYLRTAPPRYAAERAAFATRAQRLLSSLRALPTVQAFSLAGQRAEQIDEASWQAVRWTMRARAALNTFFSRLNLAECVGMATILIVAFVLVGRGDITVGAATTAMLFFLQLFGPMGHLLVLVDDLQAAGASLARIVGVTQQRPDEVGARPESEDGSAVTVRNLSYGYDDGPAVLTGVDLELAPGRRVALVGSSGAGKSTLAALIAGTMAPRSGSVALSPQAARSLVWITQEVHVFSGTVRDNLTLTTPDASDQVLREALELVGGWESVARLPEGLDTVVGDAGHPLTVAQAQLLALARVALADPALVLLDEATAEAGSAHGDQLDRAATAVMRGRASIVIAHRLSQAADADQIIVLDAGVVVERGSHAELLAAGGRYAELWSAWSRYR